jgi:hypothetical protein
VAGPTRRRADGTPDHPYSALNLRLALAVFGAVSCAALSVLLTLAGQRAGALLLAAVSLGAVVNAVVVQRRRVRRRRRNPGVRYSLFE